MTQSGKRIRLLLSAILCVFAIQCGKKGPPIVPQLITPRAPNTLKARVGCNSVILEFIPPKYNSDGSPFDDLKGVQVFRKGFKARIPDNFIASLQNTTTEATSSTSVEGAKNEDELHTLAELTDDKRMTGAREEASSSAPKNPKSGDSPSADGHRTILRFREKVDYAFKNLNWKPMHRRFKKIATFSIAELDQSEDMGFINKQLYPEGAAPLRIIDKGKKLANGFSLQEGFAYRYMYRIRLINENHDYSPLSNTAGVYYHNPSDPPRDVSSQLTHDMVVKLYWDPPGKACSGEALKGRLFYNVYLRESGKAYPQSAYNFTPIESLSFSISHLLTDRKYYLTVTAVQIYPYRESEPAKELEVMIKDVIPPPKPSNLVAIGGFNVVSLMWDAPDTQDIQGFNVYRRSKTQKQWKKINEEPIKGTTYVDRQVSTDKTYEYSVTAIDTSLQKNESEMSEPTTVSF